MPNQGISKNSATNFTKKPQQNAPSTQGKPSHTSATSHTPKAGPKGGKKQTRNEKRRRWAKKHKVAAKPVVKRGPTKEYVTKCCSALGRKPAAGEKSMAKDPESGKTVSTPKGLGKWRCSQCGKPAKVTPRKPQAAEAKIVQTTAFPPEVPVVQQ